MPNYNKKMYTGPLCGQRRQTRVLRSDPNTLITLQLSQTYHSSLSNALSTASCRHISHAPLISPQTFLRASPRLFFFLPFSHLFWHLPRCVSFLSFHHIKVTVCSSFLAGQDFGLKWRLCSYNQSFFLEIQCCPFLQQGRHTSSLSSASFLLKRGVCTPASQRRSRDRSTSPLSILPPVFLPSDLGQTDTARRWQAFSKSLIVFFSSTRPTVFPPPWARASSSASARCPPCDNSRRKEQRMVTSCSEAFSLWFSMADVEWHLLGRKPESDGAMQRFFVRGERLQAPNPHLSAFLPVH